jgi:hypothetical protein
MPEISNSDPASSSSSAGKVPAERVPPLVALFRFLFGDRRRRGDQQQQHANVRESRLGTTANKPLVSYQELNQGDREFFQEIISYFHSEESSLFHGKPFELDLYFLC